MDNEQLKTLIDSINAAQAALVTNLVSQLCNTESKADKDNLSSVSLFENYDSRKEKFSCYQERFENYCTMKNVVDDAKKAQLLCGSIGSVHYNALAAFLGPDKTIKTLNFEELSSNFCKMLIPKRSVVVSQHYFLNLYQKEQQSISEYVASLQCDLADCQFSITCDCGCNKNISVADMFLRAQFIRGLRDNWLREQLLQSFETKFDKLLGEAISLEASRIESVDTPIPSTPQM